MRLQLVREGQQYQTRQGTLLTVVDVRPHSDGGINLEDMVIFEVGGIVVSATLDDFNRQVHQLVNDSCFLSVPEDKELMIQNNIEFKYNHGEIWIGKNGYSYMILRTLRSGKSRFVLYPMNRKYDFEIENLPTSDDIELVARLTCHEPVKFGCLQVLLKDSVWDVLEISPHSVKIRSAEIEDVYDLPEELTVGFGNIVAYHPTALDYTTYREAVWACNDTKDPDVMDELDALEHSLAVNRWGVESFTML